MHSTSPRGFRLSRVIAVVAAYLVALSAVAFFAFPCWWMLTSSIKSQADLIANPPVWFFTPTFENYVELFGPLKASGPLLNSIIIVGISTALSVLFGTMAAYALARYPIKGKTHFALEVLSIRLLPPIVSVIPIYLLSKQLGIFDTHFLLIMIYTLSGLPFVVWIMRLFIQDLPKSVEEAAMVDGCSRFQVLLRITMPLLLPGLATVTVIVFMFSWNEYLFASLLTSASAKTLPVLSAATLKPKAIAWGASSAIGVVMSLPVIVIVLMMQRYLVRGLTFGAVKG